MVFLEFIDLSVSESGMRALSIARPAALGLLVLRVEAHFIVPRHRGVNSFFIVERCHRKFTCRYHA